MVKPNLTSFDKDSYNGKYSYTKVVHDWAKTNHNLNLLQAAPSRGFPQKTELEFIQSNNKNIVFLVQQEKNGRCIKTCKKAMTWENTYRFSYVTCCLKITDISTVSIISGMGLWIGLMVVWDERTGFIA